MKSVILKCVACIGLFSLGASAQSNEVLAADTTRVAIICSDVDGKTRVLTEQVEVALSKNRAIEVLDRAQIAKVLQEQAIVLGQNRSFDNYLKIAKILRVDVLTVVSAGKEYVAWRTACVKDGRLLDLYITGQLLLNVDVELEKTVDRIEKAVKKSNLKIANEHRIAVTRFVNEDVSRENDSLETVLPELINSHLASNPEIVVVERDLLRQIEDERSLAEGPDSEYLRSAIIVSGRFHMERSGATNRLVVAIAGKIIGGSDVFKIKVDGNPMASATVADELAAGIAQKVGGVFPGTGKGSLFEESKYFYLSGQFYSDQKDYPGAAAQLEVAAILAPTNAVYLDVARRARWMAMQSSGLSKVTKVSYYIREANDCEIAFRNCLTNAASLSAYSPFKSPKLFMVAGYDSQYGPMMSDAREAYFRTFAAELKWLQKKVEDAVGMKEVTGKQVPETEGNRAERQYRALLAYLDALEWHKGAILTSGIFDQPEMYCNEIKRCLGLFDGFINDVDAKMGRVGIGVRASSLFAAVISKTKESTCDFIDVLAWRSLGLKDDPTNVLLIAQDRLIGDIAQDSRPFLRICGMEALSLRYRALDKRHDSIKAALNAVRQLAGMEMLIPRRLYDNLLVDINFGRSKDELANLIPPVYEVLEANNWTWSQCVDDLVAIIMEPVCTGAVVLPHPQGWEILRRHLDFRLAIFQKNKENSSGRAVDLPYHVKLAEQIIATSDKPTATVLQKSLVANLRKWLGDRMVVVESRKELPKKESALSTSPVALTKISAILAKGDKFNGKDVSEYYARCFSIFRKGDVGYVLVVAHGENNRNTDMRLIEVNLRSRSILSIGHAFKLKNDLNNSATVMTCEEGDSFWVLVVGQLLRFKTDGSVSEVTSKDGLPLDGLQCFDIHAGHFYAGYRGGFGEWDRVNSKFNFMAGSRSSGSGPLDGGLLYNVFWIGTSVKGDCLFVALTESRNQMLISPTKVVGTAVTGERQGFWGRMLSTGETQMYYPLKGMVSEDASVHGNTLYLRYNNYAQLVIDLSNPKQTQLLIKNGGVRSANATYGPIASVSEQLLDKVKNIREVAVDAGTAWPAADVNGDLVYSVLPSRQGLFLLEKGQVSGSRISTVLTRDVGLFVNQILPYRNGVIFVSDYGVFQVDGLFSSHELKGDIK